MKGAVLAIVFLWPLDNGVVDVESPGNTVYPTTAQCELDKSRVVGIETERVTREYGAPPPSHGRRLHGDPAGTAARPPAATRPGDLMC